LELVGGKQSASMSRLASVRVQISPPSMQNNSFACGSIVSLSSRAGVVRYFVATARHVIADMSKNCRRRIASLEYQHALQASTTSQVPFLQDDVFLHASQDLALIEIPSSSVVAGMAVSVSTRTLDLHMDLWATGFREHGYVAVACRIAEVASGSSGLFQTDCGGTHGFSGMGYFARGELVGLHKGEGEFLHSSDEFSAWDTAKQDARVRCLNMSTLTSQCLDALLTATHTQARNPRTAVVDAIEIYQIDTSSNSRWQALPLC